MHRITLIPGDGIGPEVASAVVSIIEATGVEIEWEEHIAGQAALDKYGVTLPNELIESIKRNKVGLKGPITTPVAKALLQSTSDCARPSIFTLTCVRFAHCPTCLVAIPI